MNLRIFKLSFICSLIFTQLSYCTENIYNFLEKGIERKDSLIANSPYKSTHKTADFLTEATKCLLTTFYSKRNNHDVWATTYMHILMYILLAEKNAFTNPERKVLIITDTLADNKTPVIEHTTGKHFGVSLGQEIVHETHGDSGYATLLNISELIKLFANPQGRIDEQDQKFAMLLYEVLREKDLNAIFATPISKFTLFDIIGYIFSNSVYYKEEKIEENYYATSIICTLSIRDSKNNPIKLKAVYHSEKDLLNTTEIRFKTIYPLDPERQEYEGQYSRLLKMRKYPWLLRAQALQKACRSWGIEPDTAMDIQISLRDEAEKNIERVREEARYARGYQLTNYVSYLASLYYLPNESTGIHFPDHEHILDILLEEKEGGREILSDINKKIIKTLMKRLPYLISILLTFLFASSDIDIQSVHVLEDKNTIGNCLGLCETCKALSLGRGIAGEQEIVDHIALEIRNMYIYYRGSQERKDRLRKLGAYVSKAISEKKNPPSTLVIPSTYIVDPDEQNDLKDGLALGDNYSKIFFISMYSLDKVVSENLSNTDTPKLYENINVLNYVGRRISSIDAINILPYRFTYQFMWMYYTKSVTMALGDRAKNGELAKLSKEISGSSLATLLYEVMERILYPKTETPIQESTEKVKDEIQKMYDSFIDEYKKQWR